MSPRWRTALLVAGVLAVALAFRLYRFPEIPPGLHNDEAVNGLDALDVLDGERTLFFPANSGREPFQIYLEALTIRAFGPTIAAVRLPSLVAGVAGTAATLLFAFEWLTWLGAARRRAAYFAALFFAVLLWEVLLSRTAYRANWMPLLGALALWALLRGLRLGRLRDFVLAGLVVGLAQYVYLSARLLPVALAAVVLLALLARAPRPAGLGRGLVALVLAAAAAAAPMVGHFWTHPDDFFHRSEAIALGGSGGLEILPRNLLATAAMILVRGDGLWQYNYGGRPVFDALSGVCFLVGLAAVVALAARGGRGREPSADLGSGWSGLVASNPLHPTRRTRSRGYPRVGYPAESADGSAPPAAPRRARPRGYPARSRRHALGALLEVALGPLETPEGAPRARAAALVLLSWIGVMLLATVLSEGAPSFIRTTAILPALVLLPALGLEFAVRAIERFGGSAGRVLGPALAAAVLVGVGGITVRDYFFDYANRAEVYYQFHANFVEAAAVVRDLAGSPSLYLDSELAKFPPLAYFTRDLTFRKFDARRAWVLPPGEATYLMAPETTGITPERLEEVAQLAGGPVAVLPNSRGGPMLTQIRKPAGVTLSPVLDPPRQPAGPVRFADLARLDGLRLSRAAPDITGGQPLTVTLALAALRPGPADLTLSLKLLDGDDNLWTQRDSLPAGGTYPASAWRAGELILDQVTLDLPADLPPARYRLELALYALADGRALPATGGDGPPVDHLVLTDFEVTAPSPLAAAVRPPRPIEGAPWHGVTLAGYDLAPASARGGADIRVHLYWRAVAPSGASLQARLTLADSAGQTVATGESALGGVYPSAQWRAGDLLHEVRRLTVSGRAAAGPSRLVVELRAPDGDNQHIELAGPLIEARARTFSLPPGARPANAELGGVGRLAGFRLDPPAGSLRAGDRLGVTLIWQAEAETETSYAVFVQLLDGSGRLVAQNDGPPEGGAAPTSSWLPGEVIEDLHTVALPASLPAGTYRLIAGLYDLRGLQRLAVAGGGDFIELGTVRVLE